MTLKKNTNASLYVQYGCGFTVGKGWINYDNSPTLRLSRVPGGTVLTILAGGVRFPDAVRYGDILKGPLAPPQSCAGVYASHVLEHLSLDDFETALKNTFLILKPGGIFRLIVPDLDARARRYTDMLDAGSDRASDFFMESTHLGQKQRPKGLVGRLRAQIGNSAHLWMWDEASMTKRLRAAGFTAIRRCAFNDCEDPAFREVEISGRFVEDGSNLRELAIECRRSV
jgi:hypothetical protein